MGVEKQRHSFYAHWVRQFFSRYQKNRRRRDLGLAEIDAFLKALTDDPRVADWQVTQAREALVIYCALMNSLADFGSVKSFIGLIASVICLSILCWAIQSGLGSYIIY